MNPVLVFAIKKFFNRKSIPECRATCDVYKDWQALEARNAGLVAEKEQTREYLKTLVNRGACSVMSVSKNCGIPYKEVQSWYEEPEGE